MLKMVMQRHCQLELEENGAKALVHTGCSLKRRIDGCHPSNLWQDLAEKIGAEVASKLLS